MLIYEPAEDSYLLADTIKNYLNNLIKNDQEEESRNRRIASHQKPLNYSNRITNIRNNKLIKILDMGTGTGIQAQTCRKMGFNNILTADINKEAVRYLKKQGFKSIKSDLFSNINKKQKFNLIIFNPPYLPEHKYDKEKDTTAGKQGYELIIKFLKQAKSHINKDGVILLLFSSLSKPKRILKNAKSLGYDYALLSNKKLFFEELFVYILNYNHS